jgi:hypothetical protein
MKNKPDLLAGREEEILRRYPVEGVTPLLLEWGVSENAIRWKIRRMRKSGLSFTIPSNYRERIASLKSENNNSVNKTYFLNDLDLIGAYLLGFIWADGCLGEKALVFGIKTLDEDLLWKIKEVLKSTHKISSSPGIYKLGWKAYDDVKNLFDFLYNDSSIYMLRKKRLLEL